MQTPLHPATLLFGEIIWDEVQPGDYRLGGAPLNVAFHLRHLGVSARLISRVGTDDLGNRALEEMSRRGLDTSAIQRDADLPTGTARVKHTGDGSQGFEIIQPSAYDRIKTLELPADLKLEDFPLFYFGTLAQRDPASAGALREILHQLPQQTLRFLDLNLRSPFYERDAVAQSLLAAGLVKMSRAELEEVAMIGGFRPEPVAEVLPKLIQEFDLERVVVTDGPNSVYAYDNRQQTLYEIIPPKLTRDQLGEADSVGAGDAFSAVLLAGEAFGLPWTTLLQNAAEYAAAVCRFRGAIPEDLEMLPSPATLLDRTPD